MSSKEHEFVSSSSFDPSRLHQPHNIHQNNDDEDNGGSNMACSMNDDLNICRPEILRHGAPDTQTATPFSCISTISADDFSSYLQLFQYADGYDMVLMGIGSLAAIIDGFTLPVMVLIQGHLIHNFGSQQAEKVSQDCLLFAYVALVSWVASYFEVSCWMHAGQRQTARVRVKYLQSILRQDEVFFECDTTTSDVINGTSADLAQFQDAISEKVGNFLKNIAHFVGGYMVAFLQIWRIALLMIPFIPFLLLPGILYNRSLMGFSLKMQASYDKSNIIAEQALSTIRTVYSFVAEDATFKSYSESLKKVIDLGKKQGLTKGFAMGSNGIVFVIWAFLGWYGSVLITSGKANGGQVLTTGFAVMTGGLALGNAISHVKIFFDGRTAAKKIFQIINHIPCIDVNNMNGKRLETIRGRIEFHNVCFSYPSRPNTPILKELTIEFSPGQTVALVGSSGSGKSTIISLIQRFYDPLSGTIFLDEHNIKDLQLRWLRENMGLVSQEPALFATSIKNNILYGNTKATMEEIIAAATLSGAHDFISNLPDGYDTQVGERGIQMSGGQKQRIAIARAIVKNPAILLLDEATSALDTESEAQVNEALQKASLGRTTILVAHRISGICNADVVVLLQNGSVCNTLNQEDFRAYAAALSKSQQADSQGLLLPEGTNSLNQHTCPLDEASNHASNTDNHDAKHTKSDDKFIEKPNPSLWRLFSLIKHEWKQGLWGILGAAGYGVVQPYYAYLIGELASIYYIEDKHKREQKIRVYSLLFVCLSIAFLVVNIMQHYSFAVIGEYMAQQIRKKMLQKLLTFEIGWFDKDENSSGAVCSRISSDSNTVRSLIGDRISLFAQTASTVLVSAILGLCTSWRLALVMIALQPLVIQAYFSRKRTLANFAKQEARAQQEASQLAAEAVSMHKTVASFCMHEKILSSFESKLEGTKKMMTRRSYQAGMCVGIAQFILFVSWALDFWYGGLLVRSHKSTPGDIFKTFFVLVSTGRMLAEAGTLSPDMAKGSAAVQYIFNVLDRKTQIDPNKQEGENIHNFTGNVTFKNVWFAYPSRPEVLIFQDFNLEMKAGTITALVGYSGSGKSTIINLMERFYDPLHGKVMIDGRDIRTMNLRKLRHHIGLVNQEPSLFATTIRDNILYGKTGATEDEIVEAARVANAHNFISALPEGYSTSVGELGLQLSGGQKQRIAIARAVLKNPRILLLDEATSALDNESERQVQDALQSLMKGRTTIVVAHRLSTIQDADCIAVLQNGCIVEQGTHDQLLAKGSYGAYFNLFHHQTS